MKKTCLLIFCLMLFAPVFVNAQFTPKASKNVTIIVVADGGSKHSPQSKPGNAKFNAPISPLGMNPAIQGGAFTERPDFGLSGFFLIFSVGDSIGGKQGELKMTDGSTKKGIYRLIRQRSYENEPTPDGMTDWLVTGEFYILGVGR